MTGHELKVASVPESVPPVWVAGNPADVVRAARGWLDSTALQQLTTALGGPSPVTQDLTALARWSSQVLDTRRGRERRDAAPVTWTTRQIRALLTAAGPLGLLATAEPTRTAYGITVLLGGATTGNRLRTTLAHDLARHVDLGLLVAVTAERALSGHEHTTDPDSVDDHTEWANLLRYLTGAFGPLHTGPAATGGTGTTAWHDRQFHTTAGQTLRVLVAPSRSAHHRANTADGMTFLLERIRPTRRRHVLIITSAIYAPYQFFTSAPIALSDGAEHIELIGTPTTITGDPNLLTQRIAQEIHAAINATIALLRP